MRTNDAQPTSLRLPTDLKAQLKNRATTNRRSLTGEIIAILERTIAVDAKETV